MASKLSLFLVDASKTFVLGQNNGGVANVGPFVLGDVTPLELTLLTPNPTGGISNPFSVVSDQQVVKIALGTPSSTIPTVIALGTLAYVAGAGTYNGSLSCATQQAADYIGSTTSQPVTFECQVVSGNSGIFTAQKSTTILADLIKEGGVVNLIGSQSFYDAGQTDALFLGKNRTDSISSQTTINVLSSAGEVKFVRDDARTFSFGSNISPGLWSDSDDTFARRGDVVLKTGGTFSGAPYYGAAPTNANQLANKAYVDLHLPLTGGTLSGPVHSSGTTIGHPRELANVEYVLAHASTPPIDTTLTFTGSILGVNATAGSLMSYTHLHETNQVLEQGGPQYFTATRVRDTVLTGLDVVTAGAVTDADTVLEAIGLLQASKVSSSSGSFATQAGFALGSVGTPSIAATLDTNTGLYWTGVDVLAVAAGGNESARFTSSGLLVGGSTSAGRVTVIGQTNGVQLAITANASQTANLVEWYDAASTLAGRITRYGGLALTSDGVAAADVKNLRLTATSSAGAAGVELINNSGGAASGLKLLGTGGSPSSGLVLENATSGDVGINTGGVERLRVTSTGTTSLAGPLHFGTDNTNDVGRSDNNRPRDIFAAGTIVAPVHRATTRLNLDATAPAAGAQGTGDLWHESTRNVLVTKTGGLRQVLSSSLLCSVNTGGLTSTASEGSIIPSTSVNGVTLIPANIFKSGKTLRYDLYGHITTDSVAPTLALRCKLGGTIINSGTHTLPASLSQAPCHISGVLQANVVFGSSGPIKGQYLGVYTSNGTAVSALASDSGSPTIALNVENQFELVGQWNVGHPSNSWTTHTFTLEVLN